MKRLVCILMLSAMAAGVQANLLVDPGFEAAPIGVISDGYDVGTWAGWNGDFAVNNTMAHSGQQSVMVGVKDMPNADGDKYANLRQGYMPAGGAADVEGRDWTVGAWVYYDAATGAPTDAFQLEVIATNWYNYANTSAVLTVNGSDLVSGQWNYIEQTVSVGYADIDAILAWAQALRDDQIANGVDPQYAIEVSEEKAEMNTVKIQFHQNGWIGQSGVFYIDDASLSTVPEPMTLTLLGLGGLLLRRRRS